MNTIEKAEVSEAQCNNKAGRYRASHLSTIYTRYGIINIIKKVPPKG